MNLRLAFAIAFGATGCCLHASPILNGANPLVDPSLFRVTTFASGLDYPTSMARLPDGSIIIGTSNPNGQGNAGYLNFYTGLGQILRLTDTDANGIADGPGSVVASGLPGAVTSVRTFGDIVAVATVGNGSNVNSQAATITFFRQGALPTDAYTNLGQIQFAYSLGELPTVALTTRPTPGQPGKFDLFFTLPGTDHLGGNSGTVTATGLINGSLTPGSAWLTTVTPAAGSFAVSALSQVASGIRTSAGIAFAADGSLLITDNGYDVVSADELHRLGAGSLGSSTFLGYPDNYPAYNTGALVGGAGQQAFAAFVPLSGLPSVGAADVTQAPSNFPLALRQGYFVGFHGLWDEVGTANISNPVYFVDPITGVYSSFITAGQSGISKPDGLLATSEGLYVADMFQEFGFGADTGAIYLVSLKQTSDVPEPGGMWMAAAGLAAIRIIFSSRRKA